MNSTALRRILAEEGFPKSSRHQDPNEVLLHYHQMVQLFMRLRFAFPAIRDELQMLGLSFEKLLEDRVERYVRDRRGIFRQATVLKIPAADAYRLLAQGIEEMVGFFPEVGNNLRQIRNRLDALVGDQAVRTAAGEDELSQRYVVEQIKTILHNMRAKVTGSDVRRRGSGEAYHLYLSFAPLDSRVGSKDGGFTLAEGSDFDRYKNTFGLTQEVRGALAALYGAFAGRMGARELGPKVGDLIGIRVRAPQEGGGEIALLIRGNPEVY